MIIVHENPFTAPTVKWYNETHTLIFFIGF